MLHFVVPCQYNIFDIAERITLLLQLHKKKGKGKAEYYSTTVRTICCFGRETQQFQQQQTHEKRRRRFLFSLAAALTADVAAMRTHQKSRAVSSNSVDFKGQNQSHRQRHGSSTQHYIQQIYTIPKKLFKRKKVSFFTVN